jgi:hypothetical protein
VQKAAERVSWFLTSLGLALLVVGVLLGPAGQSKSLASGTGGCANDDCGTNGGATCNNTVPNVNGSCHDGGATGTCDTTYDPNNDCSGCTCIKRTLYLPPGMMPTDVCRCRVPPG